MGADGINCGDVLETYASKIIACINGHSHKDASETLNGILYICTTTSGLDGLAAGDTRTESLGTANETAYDVFLIDQTNLKIYAVRYVPKRGGERQVETRNVIVATGGILISPGFKSGHFLRGQKWRHKLSSR